MAGSYSITGFIKFENEIGLYRADYEAWILDAQAYCGLNRLDLKTFIKRKDKRFDDRLVCPVRKDDVKRLIAWFDAKAPVSAAAPAQKLDRMDYATLDKHYEEHLPVVLYDFDRRISYENPDLNPFTPYDDYLPEGWSNIVVEGFDALVPDVFIYWAKGINRLYHREDAVDPASTAT